MRVERRKNPKSAWWNDEIKTVVRRNESAWKKVLTAVKRQNKDVWKRTKKRREMLKCVYIRARKKVNEEFGRKMNEDVNGNSKLFWKEVSNAEGGKVEICNRIRMEMGD